MKWRTAAVLVGCACVVGLGYRAFGHKLTKGNLIGVKVERMVLIDRVTKQAFDEFGKPVRASDRFISDRLENPQPPRDTRILCMKIPATTEVRIRFGDSSWVGYGSSDGYIECPFPVNQGSSSVKYEVQVATDDWQQIDSWQGQKSSGNYHVRAEGNYSPIVIRDLSSYSPDPNTGFRLNVQSSKPSGIPSEWIGWPDLNSIQYYFNGPLSTIQRVTLSKLQYRTIKSGYLAFGILGSANGVVKPDHSIKLLGVIERDCKKWDVFRRWSPDGKPLPVQPEDKHFTNVNYAGKDCDLNVQVEVGETENFPSIEVLKSSDFDNFGWERRTYWDAGRTSFSLDVRPKPGIKKIDMTVKVAGGPYKEVYRLGAPKMAAADPEKPGVAVIVPASVRNRFGIQQYTLIAKLPPECDGQNLQVAYIGKDGKEHGTGMTGVTPGFASLVFESPDIEPSDIRGFVVRARKFTTQTFKGIQLYPNSNESNQS